LEREECTHGLVEARVDIAPEGPSNEDPVRPDLAEGEPQEVTDSIAEAVDRLVRRPDREAAIGLRPADHNRPLERNLLRTRRPVFALEDVLRVPETLLDVSLPMGRYRRYACPLSRSQDHPDRRGRTAPGVHP